MPGTHDAFLWYNVGDWGQYGLAVPNFGNDRRSMNDTIRYLCEVTGRQLQAIMFHGDARSRRPPSINTLTRIHKLCTRARSILASRAVPANVPNMESAHAIPAAEDFLVYPTPYFKVRNPWLKQYAGLALLALTEAYQHTDNAQALEISGQFAGLFGQYIQRIYRLLAVELFRVPFEEANQPTFTLSNEQLVGYHPEEWFTSTELIDTVPDFDMICTEDQLEVLTNGIPTSHLPLLGRWPGGSLSTSGGSTSSTSTQPRAQEAFPPAPAA